jgi:hypothetical protein
VTPVKVNGLFSIWMEVVDHTGATVSAINSATNGPRLVVHIENISSVPRGAKILASLPNGMRRIEFVSAGTAQSNWNDQVSNIPKNATRDLERDVRRNNGPAAAGEPIQCDEVHDQRGSLPWTQLTQNVPFQITITVT